MRTFLLFTISIIACVQLHAQINAFAKVTSISSITINISNVNESYDTFESGDKLIIMQMQDSVLGANTANTSAFGTISSISSAGLYEVVTISSVTESGGIPTSIALQSAPSTTFNFTENSSVQIISYPRLGGGGDYTTTADITTIDWDGNVGGVICFYVEGDLTVSHNINADGAGFKGGVADVNGVSSSCNYTTFRTGNNQNFAAKGDGIYKNITTDYELARARIANGAGGGNSHNGGGGGGGNYTEGGEGGEGWQCTQSAGGMGGLSLQSYISSSRIFLGGGGGSGEGNNNCASAGGRGGGIILISADTIKTTGTCSGLKICADGDDALNTPSPGNDGAGGGGAGGSIILIAEDYIISSNCALTVAASGGTGGTVNHNDEHGAGGGGGMGTIIYSIPEPTSVTTDNTSGTGGANGTSTGATTTSSGGGDPDDGVIDESDGGSLPIELLLFTAESADNGVHVEWQTASEINNDYFEVLRSEDLIHWWVVARQPGHGTTNELHTYEANDPFAPEKVIYYRLKQVDFDGEKTYSKPVQVNRLNNEYKFEVFPNPASDKVELHFTSNTVLVEMFDINSHLIKSNRINNQEESMDVDVSNLEKGVYILRVTNTSGIIEQIKLVVM